MKIWLHRRESRKPVKITKISPKMMSTAQRAATLAAAAAPPPDKRAKPHRERWNKN
jgi:hypothetical protein